VFGVAFFEGKDGDGYGEGWLGIEIMHAGRWQSATILKYLRNGEQVAQVLGTGGWISMSVRDL
jgi:hypothetical protein